MVVLVMPDSPGIVGTWQTQPQIAVSLPACAVSECPEQQSLQLRTDVPRVSDPVSPQSESSHQNSDIIIVVVIRIQKQRVECLVNRNGIGAKVLKSDHTGK